MSPFNFWPFAPHAKYLVPVPRIIKPTMSITEKARAEGIQLLYHFDRENPDYGGYTIAFRKSSAYKAGKMVDVAVAYCSEGDRFDKKIGRELALQNFYAGKIVQVPALAYGEDVLHDCLREMFTWHIDCGHCE